MIMNVLKFFLGITNIAGQYVSGDIVTIMPIVDMNGCIQSAGYSWCQSSENCIRQWETPCDDNYNNCIDCLTRQRSGENIACPTECDLETICNTDIDCIDTYFCRPTTMNIIEDKRCYKYSREGESCGGYTLPSQENRCDPSLECVNTEPMIPDAPGQCMRACGSTSIRDNDGNCVKKSNTHNNIPIDCTVWYDGCNICNTNNGILGGCTRMMCFSEDTPECRSYTLTGH